MRPVEARYEDPLDRIWVTCAARIGLRVVRTDEVYAATDGRGALHLGTDATLDADDGLAQMIFHELCHSLVQGPERLAEADWGLRNDTLDDRAREHACLRLQATLAGAHGLRRFFAPTTDYRAFYDALPDDPLEPHAPRPAQGPPGDAALESILARRGLARVGRAPWHPHVEAALAATAAVLAAVRGHVDGPPVPDARALAAARGSREAAEAGDRPDARATTLPSLLARAEPPPVRHPRTRLPIGAGARAHARCGGCAWRAAGGRCLQAPRRARVAEADPACERYEPGEALDCLGCGACCRAAYGAVTVRPDDAVHVHAPDLLQRERDGFVTMRRRPEAGVLAEPGDTRCAALDGELADGTPYTCRVYAHRPATCREFRRGSLSCLEARRRVGLSR